MNIDGGAFVLKTNMRKNIVHPKIQFLAMRGSTQSLQSHFTFKVREIFSRQSHKNIN